MRDEKRETALSFLISHLFGFHQASGDQPKFWLAAGEGVNPKPFVRGFLKMFEVLLQRRFIKLR